MKLIFPPRCRHGKGLHCTICYDQTYGHKWRKP